MPLIQSLQCVGQSSEMFSQTALETIEQQFMGLLQDICIKQSWRSGLALDSNPPLSQTQDASKSREERKEGENGTRNHFIYANPNTACLCADSRVLIMKPPIKC